MKIWKIIYWNHLNQKLNSFTFIGYEKKIAIILTYKFNLSDYNTWNFKKLKNLFDVTFFDLSEYFLINQKVINSYRVNSLENKLENYYILKDIKKFKILIKNFDYISDYSNLFLNNYYKKNKIKDSLSALTINNNSKKIA